MSCERVHQLLAARWELPEGSAERRFVEAHAARCPACAEAFRIWQESSALMREWPAEEAADTADVAPVADPGLSERVMGRIYAEHRGAMPVLRKTYAFTSGLRLRLVALAAVLLTMFVTVLSYSLLDRMAAPDRKMTGVLEAAHAFAAGRETEMLLIDVPVASLGDPFVYHAAPSTPEYWVALSLFGAIAMLLVLNWLSRVRA